MIGVPELESVIYGIVDRKIFNPLHENFDITAHEFGHAVTQFSANFKYEGQSGALNESMSDVIAIMAKHFRDKKNANDPDANWLIADGILVRDNPKEGTALRSMSNPGMAFRNHKIFGDDPQPFHMNNYVKTEEDSGGVHLNSGIPNHAFYRAALRIGGPSWEKAGKIWLEALDQGKSDDDFSTFAKRTIAISRSLGEGVQNCVGKAWQDVGVDLRKHALLEDWAKTSGIGMVAGLALFGALVILFGERPAKK